MDGGPASFAYHPFIRIYGNMRSSYASGPIPSPRAGREFPDAKAGLPRCSRHPCPRSGRRHGHEHLQLRPHRRGRLRQLRELHRHPEPDPSRTRRGDPPVVLRGRVRRRRDQHVRDPDPCARRVRFGGLIVRAQQAERRDRAGGGGRVLDQRQTPLRTGLDGPRHEADHAGADHLGADARFVPRGDEGSHRGRRGRDPHRDLPGPACRSSAPSTRRSPRSTIRARAPRTSR
jgi:hypothetical protein